MLSPTTSPPSDGCRAMLFPKEIPSIEHTEEIFDQLSEDDGRADGPMRRMGYRAEADRSRPNTSSHAAGGQQTAGNVPVNHFRLYPDQRGAEGQWDFYRVSPEAIVSVADIRYKEDAHFEVPGESILKIRLLLAGRLLSADKSALLQAPGAIVSYHGDNTKTDYYAASGDETKLIILHCKPAIFSTTFGLNPEGLPHLFAGLMESNEASGKARSARISLTADIFRAATEIMQFRGSFVDALRPAYLYAKCVELLSIILQDAYVTEWLPQGQRFMNERSLDRVAEAQRILGAQFADPPSIARLARIVGTNQTQLKSDFKAITGETIFGYVHRRRMERAAELLLSGARSINEVSYEVGYAYSANFTMAFKRYFGYLPKGLKQRHLRTAVE